ncbi:MAG: succinate dehydrogenase, hydrophobic membrane anchor protein [Candidatus Competibacteraceae bacterium]|nr:MAG: succinate dehydrogenase, hydrophobic membrane anchor protein [Candidatus Competibacteraceae bacterium]
MSIRTPLARVRGLGAAKDGTHHWWLQRVTAVILIPLTLWFVISLLAISHADYATFQQWLSNPIRAGLMATLLVATFYHASLGMQVIYEDYVRPEGAKVAALLVTQFVLFVLGAISVIAVLKVALGG